MIRDSIKTTEYFNIFIQRERERINKFQDKLDKNEIKEDRVISVKKKIFNIQNGLINAKYSYGNEISEIKEDFVKLIPKISKYWTSVSGYVDMIWILSLSILLDIKDTEFEEIVEVLKKDNPNDILVDFLINSQSKDWNIKATGFKFNTPYKNLESVINETDKEKAIENLKLYLDKKWYQGHKALGVGWVDNHKSKHDTYSGYWCWEAGALVKILGLDDSSLKEQQYYPYDMVHYKEELV
ncbi:PoNe immunity protein domain-containing protein [Aquimarina sp. AU58]|uniref:PoNe immunity protein domain-containing protein n=1 Tax=Aquimarina sp. AU58 TaxID=1874112 RepID=UPI000D6DC5D1|nr:PoNe immunity protein domain-containing protein [Aquimarina sp. AU58]